MPRRQKPPKNTPYKFYVNLRTVRTAQFHEKQNSKNLRALLINPLLDYEYYIYMDTCSTRTT
jgi:hypothetical protein